MKKVYLLLGLIGLIIIGLAVVRLSSPEDDWICSQGKWQKHGHPSAAMPTTPCGNESEQPLVGSDRDAHGCIGSAGYSWCDLKQKCLLTWEEACVAAASSTIPVAVGAPATFSDQALVLSPKQNEIVSSPLKVAGQALGTWFFEASLPVKLIDESGNLIAAYQATADSDWMTEKPVKFNSEIVFATAATSGYLIISKDNPSGLPANDGSIKVPVRFK